MGWIVEVLFTSIRNKKITLRGFLIGPYLPIYGFASIVMVMALYKFRENVFALFIMASLTASSLEYIASFIMEKLFKVRWWDYSEKRYHLDGRICLSNTLLFGILGVIVIYYINPYVSNFLYSIDGNVLVIVSSLLMILIITDSIISFVIISSLKLNMREKDVTEQVDKAVLSSLSILKRRVLNAFPNYKINN